jgi:phage terminase large subunit-like protein
MTFSLACPDWEQRLAAGRPPMPDLTQFSGSEMGVRAVRAFDMLRLADVPGTPTLEDAGGDWFRAILAVVFGSLDPATKHRLIRELFLLVPKKNSKTTNGALAVLVGVLLNQRPRAAFYMTAPVQDVADLAFSAVSGAIQLDPVLDRKFHVRDHLKTIVHRETKATMEIMTFDPSVVTGLKVSGGVLIDELHEIAKMPKAAKALRQLRGGMLPFPEAFLWMITTQSDGPPVGVFKDELRKARDIRDGKREGAMLPVLYEFSREQQQHRDKPWRDPANWPMVTPNLGRSIALDRLVEEFHVAEQTSDEELRAWASQHLNIEIGLALSSDSWAGAEFWEQQEDETVTLDAIIERCEVCTVGIDGGGLDDLLGLAVIGRERGTRRWLLWAHAWAHRIVLQRRKEVASKLLDLEQSGDLTIVDRPGEDVVQLADVVSRLKDAGLLPEKLAIGVDAQGINDILDELTTTERGITADQIVAITQGYKLNGSIKSTERALAGGELVHGAQLLMAWCVGNAKVEQKGNAIVITKQASGSAKIDPLMATFNAVSLMGLNPEGVGGIDDWLSQPVMMRRA